MKKILALLLLMGLVACGAKKEAKVELPAGKTYGGEITLADSKTLPELLTADIKGDEELLLSGKIQHMCMHKGDWLAWQDDKGHTLFVQFLNRAYTLEKECMGKDVLVQGYLRDRALPGGCANAEAEAKEGYGARPDDAHQHGDSKAPCKDDHGKAKEGEAEKAKAEKEQNDDMIYFVASAVHVIN